MKKGKNMNAGEVKTDVIAVENNAVENNAVENNAVENNAVENNAVGIAKKRATKVAQFVADYVPEVVRTTIGTYANGKPQYAVLTPDSVLVTVPMVGDDGHPKVDEDGRPITTSTPWEYRPLMGRDALGSPCRHPDPLRLGVDVPTPRMFADWLAYWTWVESTYVPQFQSYVAEQKQHWAGKAPEERVFKQRTVKEQTEAKVTAQLMNALAHIDLDSIRAETDPEKAKAAMLAAVLAQFQTR